MVVTAMHQARLTVTSVIAASVFYASPPAVAEIVQALPSIALPSQAARMPTFQSASKEVAMAAFPLVRDLKADAISPLASKAVVLAASGDPKDIIKTIDAGLDAFLSVPPERFFTTVRALKAATSEAANAPTCNLICMPSKERVEAVMATGSDALTVTNPVKLKAFLFQGAMSLASGEKQQYAGVLAEALKFSLSVDKRELSKLKDSSVDLILAIDNAQTAATPARLSTVKAFPKNERIEKISLQLANGLYPLVRELKAAAVAPLAGKVVVLAASGDPKAIIKTIDAGLDAFLSVPPERFFAAVQALKLASSEAVSAADCNLVCVPSSATVGRVASKMANALSVTDSSKLKAFVYQAVASLQSGNKKQLDAVVAAGQKFEASLDQAAVRQATSAAMDLLAASGAPLSASEEAWVMNFVGLQ